MAIPKLQNFVLTPKFSLFFSFFNIFLGKPLSNPKILEILKNGRYVIEPCLLHSCQILRKSINIWYPIRLKTLKNYAYQNFQLHFWEVLDI